MHDFFTSARIDRIYSDRGCVWRSKLYRIVTLLPIFRGISRNSSRWRDQPNNPLVIRLANGGIKNSNEQPYTSLSLSPFRSRLKYPIAQLLLLLCLIDHVYIAHRGMAPKTTCTNCHSRPRREPRSFPAELSLPAELCFTKLDRVLQSTRISPCLPFFRCLKKFSLFNPVAHCQLVYHFYILFIQLIPNLFVL